MRGRWLTAPPSHTLRRGERLENRQPQLAANVCEDCNGIPVRIGNPAALGSRRSLDVRTGVETLLNRLMDQSRLSVRRIESIEKAEAILLRARELHPKEVMIHFNLALLRQRCNPFSAISDVQIDAGGIQTSLFGFVPRGPTLNSTMCVFLPESLPPLRAVPGTSEARPLGRMPPDLSPPGRLLPD